MGSADEQKLKPFTIILPKRRAYVKTGFDLIFLKCHCENLSFRNLMLGEQR